MKANLLIVLMAGFGLAIAAGQSAAHDATASYSVPASTLSSTSSHNPGDDTTTPPRMVKAKITCTANSNSPVYIDAPFTIAGVGGACYSAADLKNEEEAPGTFARESITITIITAKKDGTRWVAGDRSALIGSYSAPGHITNPPATPTSTGTGVRSGRIHTTVGGVDTDYVNFSSSFTSVGATYTFIYTVTNHMASAISFTWPAVRTPDYPNGWTATAPANDSVTYSFVGLGPATVIEGKYGDITYTDTGSSPFSHSFSAYSPNGSVVRPATVSNLTGTPSLTSPLTVTLNWTSNGMYDKVRVFRSTPVTGGPVQAYTLPGSAHAFVDEDPPVGEDVQYSVYPMRDGIGAIESVSTTVEL